MLLFGQVPAAPTYSRLDSPDETGTQRPRSNELVPSWNQSLFTTLFPRTILMKRSPTHGIGVFDFVGQGDVLRIPTQRAVIDAPFLGGHKVVAGCTNLRASGTRRE